MRRLRWAHLAMLLGVAVLTCGMPVLARAAGTGSAATSASSVVSSSAATSSSAPAASVTAPSAADSSSAVSGGAPAAASSSVKPHATSSSMAASSSSAVMAHRRAVAKKPVRKVARASILGLRLPQTGDRTSSLMVVGGLLLAGLTGWGIVRRMRLN